MSFLRSLGDLGWSVEVLDLPLAGKNHDAWAFTERTAAVVDGATPLESDWPVDLKMFAKAAAEALVSGSQQDSVQKVWEKAILSLRAQFSPQGYRRSAAAGMVREVDDNLEFSTLGDVVCLVGTEHATYKLLDDRVVKLDDLATTGKATLLGNRKKANEPNGYPIFADDPRASHDITTIRVRSRSVRSFALLSDGAWRHLDSNPKVALASLNVGDLDDSFATEVERSRLPLGDDATIMRFQRADS